MDIIFILDRVEECNLHDTAQFGLHIILFLSKWLNSTYCGGIAMLPCIVVQRNLIFPSSHWTHQRRLFLLTFDGEREGILMALPSKKPTNVKIRFNSALNTRKITKNTLIMTKNHLWTSPQTILSDGHARMPVISVPIGMLHLVSRKKKRLKLSCFLYSFRWEL